MDNTMLQTIKNKYIPLIALLPVIAILLLAYWSKSWFILLCGGCLFIFLLLQIVLSALLEKSTDKQSKYCRYICFFGLPPAFGLIAAGILILFLTHSETTFYLTSAVMILCAVVLICLALQLFLLRKNCTIAARFLRFVVWASISVPLSMIITLMLFFTGSGEAASLSSMTVIILGSIALLIAFNMILVSFFQYKSTGESIAALRFLYRQHKLVFTRISITKDAFLVVAKGILSLISASFFMLVNCLYSAGMGIARFIALKMHGQDRIQQVKSYRIVGIIIAVASLCYVIYSIRLLFGGSSAEYSMNIALVIALYTFVEFGINVREALRLRKSKALEAKALRAISFASTLLCFVLTQTAIMSFASQADNRLANVLAGLVFGGLAALIGAWVIVDSFLQEKAILP